MKHAKLDAMLMVALAVVLGSGAHASETAAILKSTGHHGGLCLVVGGDEQLAAGLASGSNLYVYMHRTDEKAAAALALKFAGGDLRERVVVRDGKLVTSHYGSELFNLIVIKGWGKDEAAGLTLRELERILVPGGSLAVSGAPAGLEAQAAKLKLEKLPGTSGFAAWRKPRLVGEDWTDADSRNAHCNPKATVTPCYNLRWRSGLQFNRGHKAIHPVRFANGRMVYRELHPAPWSDKIYSYHLTARDAFNGRVLWSKPGRPFDTVKANRHLTPGGLDAHGDRVYAVLGGKVSCFDAETGKLLYTVKDKDLDVLLAKKPHSLDVIRLHGGKYLLIGAPGLSLVCDAASGRRLWQSRLNVARGPIENGAVYVKRRETYMALNLADGKKLWSVDGAKNDMIPKGQMRDMFCTGRGLHIAKGWQNPYRLDTLDLKTGKRLWTYRAKPIDFSLTPDLKYPVAKGRYKERMTREVVAYDDEIYLIQKQCLGWNGTFSYVTKLDAKTGKVIWRNEKSSFFPSRHPHGGAGISGLSALGPIALLGDTLVVSNGRTRPMRFDAKTGERLRFESGWQHGSTKVVGAGDRYFNGGYLFDLKTCTLGYSVATRKQPAWSIRPVVEGSRAWANTGQKVRCWKLDSKPMPFVGYNDKFRYDYPYKQISKHGSLESTDLQKSPQCDRVWIKAGNRLFASRGNKLMALSVTDGAELWSHDMGAEVGSVIAGRKKLIVSTVDGRLTCFGKRGGSKRLEYLRKAELSVPAAAKRRAARILGTAKKGGGCVLVAGIVKGDLVKALAQEDFYRVVVFDPDAKRIAKLHSELVGTGLFGTRVDLICGDIAGLPPYQMKLICSEKDLSAYEPEVVFDKLRPYGGRGVYESPGISSRLKKLKLSGAKVESRGGLLTLTREGALEGSSWWTHDCATPGHTLGSEDTAVRGPLGVTWYGGPAAGEFFANRHDGAPR